MYVGFSFDASEEISRAFTIREEEVTFQEETFRLLGVAVDPKVDGRFHRFNLPGSRKMNGWYVLTTDETGTTFGSYGDWSSEDRKKLTFCSKKRLTKEEMAEQGRRIQRIMEDNQALAKAQLEWLNEIWPGLDHASEEHPYAQRKHIHLYGDIRQMNEFLCIPMEDSNGSLADMQKIPPDGRKRFVKDLPTKGLRHIIRGNGRTFLCEGYATGSSIHEATGATVVVCFSAGNLIPVSAEYPTAVVVADNDASHTGEEYARKTGLKYILIPDEGMDANDYALKYGVEALKSILIPEVAESWSVPLNSWLDEPKPLSWLIKGWIPRDSVCTCFGASGSGKTFIVLDMMLCITTGQPDWHGYRTKPGNVFYMCGEGYAGMRGRAKAWALEHGISDLGNINITQSAKDLVNPNDLQSVLDEIDSLPWKPDLVTIDTLNRFYSGDENAADKIHAFLDAVQTIQRKYGCSILIVHHTGVSQEAQSRGRGSSALRAAMDVEFSVEKQQEQDEYNKPVGPAMLLVTQRKQKDIEFLDPMGFRLKAVDLGWIDEDGDPVTSAVPVGAEMVQIPKLTIPKETLAWLMLRDNFVRKEPHQETSEGWLVGTEELIDFASMWLASEGNPEEDRKALRNKLRPGKSIGNLLGKTVKSTDERGWYVVSRNAEGFVY